MSFSTIMCWELHPRQELLAVEWEGWRRVLALASRGKARRTRRAGHESSLQLRWERSGWDLRRGIFYSVTDAPGLALPRAASRPLTSRTPSQSGKTKQIYRGHTGPVTSLDFYTVPSPPAGSSLPSRVAREVLISGSWDKSVRVWDVQVRPRALGSLPLLLTALFKSHDRQRPTSQLHPPTPTLSKRSS